MVLLAKTDTCDICEADIGHSGDSWTPLIISNQRKIICNTCRDKILRFMEALSKINELAKLWELNATLRLNNGIAYLKT